MSSWFTMFQLSKKFQFCDVLKIIGTSFSVMYFILGFNVVVIFIINNNDSRNRTHGKVSYALLGFPLFILFVGFLTSLILITCKNTQNRYFIIPWLVFHLIFIIISIVGGTGFLLNFFIHQRHCLGNYVTHIIYKSSND